MPSINLDLDYWTHPKVTRLVGLLGRGAEVLPIRLWTYCGKYHSDYGALSGYTEQEIEAICGWWGEKGKLIPALLDCGRHIKRSGFLEKTEDGTLIVHNWLKHAGHIEAYKRKSALMVDARRKALEITSSSTSSTTCSSTMAVQGSARQGKAVITDSCGEFGLTADSPPEPAPFLIFQTDGAVREWMLYKAKVAEYKALFPSIDVEFEMRKACQWIKDNPSKRKTAKGMAAFLTNWLSRTQDRSGNGNGFNRPNTQPSVSRVRSRTEAGEYDKAGLLPAATASDAALDGADTPAF
jgi:hypothetical protein